MSEDEGEDYEIIGNEAAAEYVTKATGRSVTAGTWRGYLLRKVIPEPHRRELRGGHALPVWYRSALDTYIRTRPGQGHRSDLAKQREDQ